MDNEKEIIQPSYYGILPANVRYCKTLPPAAKILFTELSALTNKNGYCNAKNKYFADLYDVSERIVSTWFQRLEENGFIRIELLKTQIGTSRKVYLASENQSKDSQRKESSISDTKKCSSAHGKQCSSAHTKEFSEPQEEKFVQNNKNINTKEKINNINLSKEAENKFSTKSDSEFSNLEEKEAHSEKDCGFVYQNEEIEETQETDLDPMPNILEEICIENDFDAIPMFPIMPKADWIMTKIKAFGRSGFVAVLQEIENYAQKTPNYIGGKVECLAKVFNHFAKTKEDKFDTECKNIISNKYKELTGEGLETTKSDIKHLKVLIGKMRKSITEITGNEATDKEVLAGLSHIMKKLPAEFCNIAKFKIPLIAHNYQQIKLQIKNGTATNNNKKSVTGNAELDARLANNYGQGIGNIDPIYGF